MPILRISDELHAICDEIQAEYDKTVAAMNRAAGK